MRERLPGITPTPRTLAACAAALTALAALCPTDLADTAAWSSPQPHPDRYGFDATRYARSLRAPTPGETLPQALRAHGVSGPKAARADDLAAGCCDVPGSLLVYRDRESGQAAAFIHRADVARYVAFDFRDSVAVYEGFFRPVVRRRRAQGEIGAQGDSALHAHGALSTILARALAWQVDFHRLKQGDRFFAVYDEERTGGIVTRLDVVAARIRHGGQDHWVYGFAPDDGPLEYYDADGRPVRRQFLRAPIEYTRVSSRFSRRRLHPIEHRYKPHLGTDLAAPEGTPIVATAAGVVAASGWTARNGHYVKVDHGAGHATAYLHMSRRAASTGEHVRQGALIGYVGSTGAATGAHVCYRLWQNGTPVDALQLAQPPTTAIAAALRPAFEAHRDSLLPHLSL